MTTLKQPVHGVIFSVHKTFKNFSKKVSRSCDGGPIKGEGKDIPSKSETWKERIKTNFLGQDVPYDMHCNETAVLKIDSVCK